MTAGKRSVAREIVRHDARPFLVQVIDRAIARECWHLGDAEAFTIAATSLALRYLAQRNWDPRDLAAVRVAAEIVLMYVSDGLDQLSDGDPDRAVDILDARPLVECFRKGWPEANRLRRQIVDAVARARVRWGPHVVEATPPHVWDVLRLYDFHLCDFHRLDVYQLSKRFSDEEFLEHFRMHGTLHGMRSDLGIALRILAENAAALAALPLDTVRAEWHAILEPTGEGGYLIAWGGAVVRALTRGDLGVTIRPDELRMFVAEHVDGYVLRAESYHRAVARLTELLPAVPSSVIAEAVAAVAGEINANCGASPWLAGPPGGTPGHTITAWYRAWAHAFGIVVTDAERSELLAAEDLRALGRDVLLNRFAQVETREERIRMLDALDLPSVPVGVLSTLLHGAPILAGEIVSRVDWARRTPEELAALVAAERSQYQGTLTEAIVYRRPNLHDCPPELIANLCADAHIEGFAPTFDADLLDRWGVTPPAFTRAFKDIASGWREWLLPIAVASPPHFADLLFETHAFMHLRNLIEAVFAERPVPGHDADLPVSLDPEALARCFAWMEDRERRRKRKRTAARSADGSPIFADPDLRELWPHVSERYRQAITRAIPESPTPARARVHQERGRRGRPRGRG